MEADQLSLMIEATVQMRTLNEMGWKNFEGLKYDSRPSIFANGLHHISFVEECADTIVPGQKGKVTLLTMSDSLLDAGIVAGSHVKLMSGPVEIASAEILSIEKVLVKKDEKSKKGYSISEA